MKNTFNYRIYQNVYNAMLTGHKTMEIRLLNEKSESIQKGDEIIFSVLDSDKTLKVEVINKYIYDSVDELWKDKNVVLKSAMDYSKAEFIKLLNEIYGEEKVSNSKLVGIEFIIK